MLMRMWPMNFSDDRGSLVTCHPRASSPYIACPYLYHVRLMVLGSNTPAIPVSISEPQLKETVQRAKGYSALKVAD